MGPECLGDWRARCGVPTTFCEVSEGRIGRRSFGYMCEWVLQMRRCRWAVPR